MTTLGDIIAGAAQKYGQDPSALLREAQVESGMNPNAHNAGSGADGLFQFIPGTAAQYGLTDTRNVNASADAAARLMRDNANYLAQNLGRAPTAGELYLAHQQGPAGAVKILQNPDAPLASLVGQKAASGNGGAGMTGGQFAQMWSNKFNGTRPTDRPVTLADALPNAAIPAAQDAPIPAPSLDAALAANTPDPASALAAQAQAAAAQRAQADQARRVALLSIKV